MHLRLVSIPVSDVDGSKAFYTEKLGFEERYDGPGGHGGRWVELGLPGDRPTIALVTWYEAMPPGSAHGLALHSDDARTDRDALAAVGVEIEEVVEESWGLRAMFKDPDGNGWVLIQPPGS